MQQRLSNSFNGPIRFGALAALFILILAGCDGSQDSTVPSIIRVGVLPDEDIAHLHERYDLLITHLSASTGVPHELVVPGTYGALLHLFEKGEVHLAYFGGFTFIAAQQSAGATPLVMRDIDANFTSFFIVGGDSLIEEVEEAEGGVFSFGSNLSTSGHLMPRKFLNDRGIRPEEYFGNVLFSGSHDKTAFDVRDGVAVLGVINAEALRGMFGDGRLSRGDVRIIWETPPFPDYVWAAQNELGAAFHAAIREAFLSLSVVDPIHRDILARSRAGHFLPASDKDFAPLKIVAKEMGLLND